MISSSVYSLAHDVEITSRANAQIKEARKVIEGRDARLILVEGLRLCEEAVAALETVEQAFFIREVSNDPRFVNVLERARKKGAQIVLVSASVFDSLSDTKSPQGVALIAPRPIFSAQRFIDRIFAADAHSVLNRAEPSNNPGRKTAEAPSVVTSPLLVILHQINNPSNAGAMLRVAEAAGAHGVISTDGTVDLFGTKALRGAMGATFRVPLWSGEHFVRVIEWCRKERIITVAATTDSALMHTDHDWRAPCAIVIGNEAHGLNNSEISSLDARIRIPMRSPVESLNAATALAVVLYEAARQRGYFAARPVG